MKFDKPKKIGYYYLDFKLGGKMVHIELKKYLNKYKLILLIGILLVLTSIGILIVTNNHITIIEEEESIQVSYRGRSTVKDILADNNIELKENDVVQPTLTTVLGDGDTITIKEAYSVSITADDKVYTFNTTYTNVKDIIKEGGISLSNLDIVSPELETAIDKNGDKDITVVRVTEDVEENREVMKHSVETKNNTKIDKGIVNTLQKGRDGEKLVTEKVVYHDGEEFSRQVLSQDIVKEPVNEVKEVGTNTMIATSRGSQKFTKVITVTATGYCSCDLCVGGHNGSITASGRHTTAYRTVAASSNFSFGTNLFIPYFSRASNGGVFVVEDRGGSIRGNKIDIYFDNHEDAVRFGRRTLKVYVLE